MDVKWADSVSYMDGMCDRPASSKYSKSEVGTKVEIMRSQRMPRIMLAPLKISGKQVVHNSPRSVVSGENNCPSEVVKLKEWVQSAL